jgi:hypothetical protein
MTELPNGIGSFHQHEKDAPLQHKAVWSHDIKKSPTAFPAQHCPNAGSLVTCENIKDGVRLTYRKLQGDDSGVLVQELTVEPETGDLVIRQSGKSDNPGVFGIAFSILNLRPDIKFAVPYFGGQTFGAEINRGSAIGYAWPSFWSAGLIIASMPDGGSFSVFADDPRLSPKYLKIYDSEKAQGLSFEACAEAPYKNNKDVNVCAWRFNVFEDSWIKAAKRYKEWLRNTYGLKPIKERPPEWFGKISLIWPSSPSMADAEKMKENISPQNILIVNYGWAEGFNRYCPLYKPKDKNLADTLKKLHTLGYHYGVYVAEKLVDRTANSDLMKRFNLKIAYDALSGQEPELDEKVKSDKETKQKNESFLVGIHPGGNDWVSFYSDLLVEYHKKFGIDCFYEDVAGANMGSSGMIDGRGIHEGTVACEQEIRRKLPEVTEGGEHWNEVCVASKMSFSSGNYAAWFGEGHHRKLGENAHPLQGCIFNDFTLFYNYKTPIRETEKFHIDYNFIEVAGMYPVWTTSPEDIKSEARIVLERAKLFADSFEPYYPDIWEKDVIAYMRDPKGRLVKYFRTNGSTFCYLFDNGKRKLIYARITKSDSVHMGEPVYIDDWSAYGNSGPIGLNPSKWYCIFPGQAKDKSEFSIRDLPKGAFINGSRLTSDYCLLELSGNTNGAIHWDSRSDVYIADKEFKKSDSFKLNGASSVLFKFKSPHEPAIGQTLPLQNWNRFFISNGFILGNAQWLQPPRIYSFNDEKHHGYTVYPPRGGKGSEFSIDGLVRIPADKKIALSFYMGRSGGIGDGVHFIVRVNGKEIWRQFSPPNERKWTPAIVPLADYAGKDVIISLALDSGKTAFNTSNDQSTWGDPMFTIMNGKGK